MVFRSSRLVMGLEIERKFLVLERRCELPARAIAMCQGYLATGNVTVRVRVAGPEAWLTLKSDRIPPGREVPEELLHAAKAEYEYPIPLGDAHELLGLSEFSVSKTRYYFPEGFEYDVFEGNLEGLELLEFEGDSMEAMPPIPEGLTVREVTTDRRFSNAALARQGLPPDVRALLGLHRG